MHRQIRTLAFALACSGLALQVQTGFAAESGAEPSQAGAALPARTRVEPAPQLQGMEALARTLSAETETVWLETNSDRTLTLYYPAIQANPVGALILLPDEHRHPDWPTDLHPLRIGLAQHGWDTLAVSLPAADPPPIPERTLPVSSASASPAPSSTTTEPPAPATGAEPPLESYGERVEKICEAAMRHLESRQRERLILLGSGTGATWAAQCAKRFQDSHKLSLILLEPRIPETPRAPELTTLMPELKMAILDLYRLPDTPLDRGDDRARRRAHAMQRAGAGQYHQSRLPPRLPDDGDWLVREVRGRIDRYLLTPKPVEPEPEPTTNQRPGG
ncbi:DUF3530 family protein [Marinobacterium aestuariivivens]|uniref:DUF3530 family protein n=1 Tax=Marinobacterium aestuariivivens TaxID=1698799 RepID=A0ABW1ZWT8_9GAMM